MRVVAATSLRSIFGMYVGVGLWFLLLWGGGMESGYLVVLFFC